MRIITTRSQAEVGDAASLMRGLYEANKALYQDDLKTIEEYYRGAWFLDTSPTIPSDYRPPNGDVLVCYRDGKPAGTVAIYRMDRECCELKSMFVATEFRGSGVARALCNSVIELAKNQGYRSVRLTTGARQTPARRLYESIGFQIVEPWEPNPPEGYEYFELGVT